MKKLDIFGISFIPYVYGITTFKSLKFHRIRWTQYEKKNIYKVLVGKFEGKRPFVIYNLKLEDNIKINFKEIGYVGRVQ
jgi:hypothetical protein